MEEEGADVDGAERDGVEREGKAAESERGKGNRKMAKNLRDSQRENELITGSRIPIHI